MSDNKVDASVQADYVVVNETSGAIDVYINNGRAATWTVGDGVHLADMDGKSSLGHEFW